MVVDVRFRETEVQHLALSDQLLDRAGDVLDRHVRIDAMLVEQIDAVGAETLERCLDDLAICSGRLFRPPVPPSMSKPNFVAIRTLLRIGSSASPTRSSLVYGP